MAHDKTTQPPKESVISSISQYLDSWTWLNILFLNMLVATGPWFLACTKTTIRVTSPHFGKIIYQPTLKPTSIYLMASSLLAAALAVFEWYQDRHNSRKVRVTVAESNPGRISIADECSMTTAGTY